MGSSSEMNWGAPILFTNAAIDRISSDPVSLRTPFIAVKGRVSLQSPYSWKRRVGIGGGISDGIIMGGGGGGSEEIKCDGSYVVTKGENWVTNCLDNNDSRFGLGEIYIASKG